MSETKPQSYADHGKLVLGYHGVLFVLLVLNLGYAGVRVFTAFSVASVIHALTAAALILLFWYTRVFATQNQDRIIRLEERLRLERLLPDDMKSRVGELTVPQLVGLRFASDGELPSLAQRALDEKLGRDQIKKEIREWRADHARV
jgi:hypothetical protein